MLFALVLKGVVKINVKLYHLGLFREIIKKKQINKKKTI